MVATQSRAARTGKAPTIRITATPKKRVAVELLGVDYMIKPPKTSLLLAISSHADKTEGDAGAVNRDFQTILKLMFDKKDLAGVIERLNSADDELDLDHIFTTVEKITEESSGDPTS